MRSHSLLIASLLLVGCAEAPGSVAQPGDDAGATDVRGPHRGSGDALAADDVLPPSLDAQPQGGTDVRADAVPVPPDEGPAYPSACAYTGKFCTGTIGDVNCIPRQDPRPAMWDWGPQEAETRLINCDIKPLDLGKASAPQVSPSGYIVTQLTPKGGIQCADDLVIQPGQACYMRARFDTPTCTNSPCKYVIPSWSIYWANAGSLFFGPLL